MVRRTVAVVGGGCAGVLVATQLLRCTDADVDLVDPGTPGGGLAYDAAEPWHLLNSRAGTMSAEPGAATALPRRSHQHPRSPGPSGPGQR
jgi:uncharacterized NAD(P)/FAD-binding protein YdhS